MKGTFFAKPLEWKVETVGEKWTQGTTLNGTLSLKNHGTEKLSLENAGISLGHADIKKVHARDPKAFTFESQLKLNSIAAGETIELPFSFKLSDNSPITDKKSSYYLCYGKDFLEANLQVQVLPRALFGKVIELLDNFHRFKSKECKTVKGGVEYKIAPPSSREFANVDQLNLTFKMDGDQLHLKFDFKVKKLDNSAIGSKLTKDIVSSEIQLALKEYSMGKDMINQDGILKSIQTVLGSIKLNPY